MVIMEQALDSSRSHPLSHSIPLFGILLANLLAVAGGAIIQLALVWWILHAYAAPVLLAVLSICVSLPLYIGAMTSGLLVGRFGPRRLILISRSAALVGAFACTAMLATDTLTIGILLIVALLTYGAMAPSMTAGISRVPAFAQFAGWRIASFHAANRAVMVFARIIGLGLAGVLVDSGGEAVSVGAASFLVTASLVVTVASFPRDRLGRAVPLTTSTWVTVTRRVLSDELLGKIGFATIVGVSLLVAAWTALTTVVLPLMSRVDGLSASALSSALGICAIATALGAVAYRLMESRIGIRRLSLVVVWLIVFALSAGALDGRFVVIVGAAAVSAAAGACLATGLIATLQRGMPNSLQAQLIGLWQSLVISASVLVLPVVGASGSIATSAPVLTLAGLSIAVAATVTVSYLNRQG